jgi:hypothetical protein
MNYKIINNKCVYYSIYIKILIHHIKILIHHIKILIHHIKILIHHTISILIFS